MQLPDPGVAMREWCDPNSVLWTQWNSAWLDDDASLMAIPRQTGGSYVLGMGRSPARSVKLRRLLGDEPHGVLDIGESKDLRVRLLALRRCIRADDVRGHMAGWRFRALRLHEKLEGTLYISWAVGADSYKMEGRMLASYLAAFGELPPLNYKYNWSLLA